MDRHLRKLAPVARPPEPSLRAQRSIAATVATILMAARVEAAQLPVPCVAGNCGKGPSVWVTSGAATATVSANTLRVTQTTDQAVLNWASFNVSADGHVIFQQPSSTSVALNRIFQESPSNIFGRVDANGQIYLVNPNGFVFGPTAKVNAAGILASTLWMKDTVFQNGILSPNATGNRPNPALEGSNEAGDLRVSVLDANDQPVLGQDGKPIKVELVVQQGAQIASSGVGGRVLLASQSVTNAGTVSSPDGQVIVAAGQRVYLQASADPSLRGLLVEVDVGGKAWNQLSGQLQAARGNVTVAGMAVNQDGRVSASSTVSANGSIRLVAQDTIAFAGANQVPVASHTGSVELGSQSVTEVLPELTDTATAVDEQAQLPSKIDIAGEQVILKGGSRITAPSGQLTVTAVQDLSQGSVFAADSNARIHVDTGATIDLSGSTATLPMSSNLVTVELRGNELATSPDQRNGALRGKPVVVDARVGTPLADVSAAIAAIPKTIAQRTSTGGQAVFQSAGDVVVANGATVNVSGGAVNYLGGTIATSQLITADGKFVDIGQADPTVQYIGVFTPTVTVKHDRWGVIDSIPVAGIGHYEQGYTQGSAAGTVKFVAPQMVLNGTFVGHSVNGPYQRTPATAAPGGTLVIGAGDATTALGNPNYLAPSVNFSTTAPPIAVGDDGSLPGALPVTLPTDFLTEGGFTRTEIYSNGTVTIPGGTPLSLLSSFSYNRDPTATSSSTKLAVVAGSSLLVRAPQVSVRSDITASGGSIDIGSTVSGDTPANPAQKFGIDVASGVTLDVRGTWINDSLLPIGQRAADPLLQAGGTIKLSADADLTHETVQDGTQSALTIGSGVQLHASGGAWFQTSGKLTPGAGGNLTLSSTSFTPTNSNSTFSLGDNIGLDAFGVAGAAGGSFTLRAGRIDIGADSQWQRAQVFPPAIDPNALVPQPVDPNASVHIGSALFNQYGFSTVSLVATGSPGAAGNGDVLTVNAFTPIVARTDSLELDANPAAHVGGGTITNFAHVITLPEGQRTPSTVNLGVNPRLQPIGRLDVQQGSRLQGDARSTFNLTNAGGGIRVDGAIVAHAGSINLLLDTPNATVDSGFDPALRLELGSTALLDVSGTPLYTPNESGLLLGQVLSGGSVGLLANRGSVVMQRGSVVNASGTAAQVDIATGSPTAPYARELLGSNGGSIEIHAPESMTLLGSLQGAGGVGSAGAAPGGSLAVELTRFGFVANSLPFPQNPRIIELRPGDSPLSAPGAESGVATLNESMIAGGGFNSLKLETDGQLQLDAGVHLAVGGKLELYSPEIAVESGGDVSLRGAYVALGYNRGVASTATPSPGKGSLQVSGDVVDLLGSTVLQGVSRATIASGGDLRLRDVALPGSTVNTVGDLSLNGDLVLSAARIYPTSATRFSITTSGDVSHTVELKQVGTSSGVPLSVAGSVRIASSNIIQGGTLLAPFGKIELNGANSLTLTAGSVTSVSAGGALLPYGETQNGGKQWVYGLDANSQPAVVQGTPTGSVTLGGGAVKLDAGSVVDISGGGDLYAFEYVPGTGGKTDALNPANTPGLYAVLPSLSGQYAPIDKDPNYTNSSLQPGDSIYLSGLPGLPAGVYPLLPARYALLPGAFLVRAVPGSTNLQPGTVTGLPNGTPVVAGYRTFANNTLANAQYTGFAVYPGSYGRALAEYDDSLASKFFTGSASVPADAGRLNLLPVTSLDALGTVKTAPATGGRGATINLAATQLEVVGQPTGGTVGTVQISSAVLNAWNPSRLLLGGQWSADDKSIEVDADTVSVAGDANLSLGEITMVARNSVAVHSGAKVSSTSGTTGTAPKTAPQSAKVTLTGTSADGAALLAVSDSSSPLVQRASGAGGSAGGQILIDNGAHLASRGALVVDAPSGGALLGTFEGPGASWSVASNHLIFGAAPDPSGLVLTPGVLSQMQTVKSLRLASASTIDFQTPVSLGTGSAPISELTLVAQGLNNLTSGGASTFAATNIVLQGTAGASATPTTVPGQGSLTFSGTNVDVGGGTLAVSGFGKTSFNASGGFVGRDAGSLIANGDLTVTAARISAGVGSDRIITATGLTQLIGVNAGPGSPLPALELGGSLAFHSARITDSATIVAPSGIVSLQATDGLTLTSAASIDVAGTNVSAGGRTVSSSAGAIQLVSGGDLSAVAGSKLNVSGIGGSNAGLVQVTAQGTTDLGSTLLANAGSGAKGGSFEFRSGSLTNFSDLSSRLQAGGFTQEQSTHVSTGDLVVSAGSAAVVAHKVELITDGGSVDVAGTISAPSGADRSSLRLYGAQGVTLEASGALHADATGSGGPGSIEIGTSAGAVNLVSGSTITAAGSAGLGELRIRAPADTINNDIKVTALNSDLSKVGSVVLEPVMVFSSVFTDPTAAPDLTSVLNDTNNYANAALPNISQRLNANGALPVSVQPGIELQGNGDITVGALDLSQWRFGPSAAAPPILTVRTTGSINVTGTISDGVTGSGTALNLPQCDATACPYSASASIRLTAGADLASADPNSVKTGGAGDLSLAASSVVRTGTGFISLNAAHDVKFGAGASVYTTGTPASTTVPVKKPVSTMTFPSLGGELNVNAGHDVIGAPVQQSVTAWQPRQVLGGLTQWGVDIGKFKWNLGTLGGGDLHVTAGHNVVDLSAATADSAIELSNRSAMSLYGGGSLAITAGNDIQSGMFYVAHGAGSIYAHGAIAASPTWTSQIGDPLGVLLQMGDAKVGIGARKDIVLEGILNPFVQPILGAGAGLSYFLTYGEQASLDLQSTAGNLSINEQRDSRRLGSFLTNTFAGLSAFQGTSGALPGSITLHALSGDVLWSSTGSQTTALMPTDRGQLDVFAALDFLGGLTPVADGQPFQPGNSGLTMSDALTAGIATPLNPVLTPNLGTYFNYAVSARHVGDASPVLISAGRDIAGLELRFPKASRITAGRDITDVNLFGQNLGSADVTLISAGRDFTYSLANNSGQVQVGGPGRLDVLAGRQVDLGTSGGITTAGRLVNPNIPSAGGADLTVVAGLGAGMNVKQFIDDVVLKSSTDRAALVSFMEAKSGNKGMTVADAASAFEALDIDSQRPFVLDVFFSTLVQAGRDANTKPSTAFKGGYAAIDALFPGSRSTSNPYFGDISLAFSRIYTLAGGDISLVIPGGKLNVGLAVPPPTVGTRPASDLGIVAEGTGSVRVFAESDVLVNASRIFTLLGGDIAIWSTLGNIDAGKGAKSSVSAPPPTVSVDASGKVTINFTGAVSGSGIRTILTEPGITPGNVDLIAPVGFVNAGDAGVGSAGNLNIAAAHVIGLDNIQVAGLSTGVPPAVGGLGASLAGASSVGSSSTNTASAVTKEAGAQQQTTAPIAESALSWLDVFVEGFGEETCKPNDTECLNRNRKP